MTFAYEQVKDCNGVDVPFCTGADGGSSVDAFGRRDRRTAGGQTRHYLFDGDTLLGEITGGSVTKVFTWGAAGLMFKASAKWVYYEGEK